MTGKIIPNTYYKNKIHGRMASMYGAKPFGDGWELVTNGFTVAWPDGTVGTMGTKLNTFEEAEAYVKKMGNFSGWNQLYN